MRTGRVKLVLLLVAAAIGGLLIWAQVIRPDVKPKNFGVVDEGRVYRSGQLTPSAMRGVVEREHIKTVIDLGSYWDEARLADPVGEARNQRVADALGVRRYVMPLVGDGTGNANWYIHALRIMNDPARQPVLVHCGAGSERTSVASILYEQLRHGDAPNNAAAVEEARTFRHNPRKNPHVREVLDAWGVAILKCVREGGQLSDPKFEAIPEPRPVTAHVGPADIGAAS